MGSKDKWARAAVVIKGQAGLTYTHWKMTSSSNHNICRGQCSTCTFSGHLHAYIAQLQQRQETSRQSQVFKLAPKHPIPIQTHYMGQRCQGVNELAGGNTVWGHSTEHATSHVLESSAWAYWFCHHSKAVPSPLGTPSACGMILSKSESRLARPHTHTRCAVWDPEFKNSLFDWTAISLLGCLTVHPVL